MIVDGNYREHFVLVPHSYDTTQTIQYLYLSSHFKMPTKEKNSDEHSIASRSLTPRGTPRHHVVWGTFSRLTMKYNITQTYNSLTLLLCTF